MSSLDTQVGGQHYKDMAIQPVEFIQKNHLPYCEAAVVKYVCRHRSKNGAEDILKARHFLDLLLELEYEDKGRERKSDLDLYQDLASETAIYPTLGHPIVYPALGLAGEAGEVAEKVKKLCRDDGMMLSKVWIEALKKELGDVLWYVSEVARQAGLALSDVASANIEKLQRRQKQGCLNGSGDDREQAENIKGDYRLKPARVDFREAKYGDVNVPPREGLNYRPGICPDCGFEVGHAGWCEGERRRQEVKA